MPKSHPQKQWIISPEANAAFVSGMEDVLAVYQRPQEPACPLVCLDESPKQLASNPGKTRPKGPARHEYARNGTANLFMPFTPLEDRRDVTVT
jgi:hypothetical protein